MKKNLLEIATFALKIIILGWDVCPKNLAPKAAHLKPPVIKESRITNLFAYFVFYKSFWVLFLLEINSGNRFLGYLFLCLS